MSTRIAGSGTTHGRWVWGLVVLALLVGTALGVYLMGGTKTAWPHAFYIPVTAAAVALGMRAGVVTALAAGLLCGPIMPLDVVAGIPQRPSGWLVRTAFFVSVAIVTGMGRNRIVQLADARQRFLSAVSHEMRTPLASVLGFSELMAQNHDELSMDEYREFALLIFQEATELSNVIDHYVLAGRVDRAEGVVVDSSAVDLAHVVRVVLAGIPPTIRESRIVVTGASVTARADPLRVRQIVRALVNNGLAYGGERLVVEITETGRSATVTIRDEGAAPVRRPAISPQPSEALPPHPPLGVGLAVARRLALLMGGELRYRINGGTTFELHLPRAHEPRRRAARGRTTPVPGSGMESTSPHV